MKVSITLYLEQTINTCNHKTYFYWIVNCS